MRPSDGRLISLRDKALVCHRQCPALYSLASLEVERLQSYYVCSAILSCQSIHLMNLLALIKQLPKGYKVCLLKNEFGDLKGTPNKYVLLTEVDSELAKESNIDGVQEMLNGCLCCTLVISFMT